MRKLFFMSKCLPKTTFFRMWSTLRASKNRAPFQTTTFKSWWCIDFLILILTLIPFVSSISTTILPNYQPGETMIIEIQGNLLEPIAHSDIIFKRSHVAIAVDYDVKKILDKYYIYAQVPITPNNYTLFINNIKTTINGNAETINYNKTFKVSGNITDYSINPGFIVTNSDFFIIIKSNLDQQTIINTNFPDEGAITLNPGTNTLKFSIIQMPKGIYSAVFGKYTIPINIIGQQINQSTDKLTVSPKLIRETLKQGKQKNYTFSITNEGQKMSENIYFSYSKEIFEITPQLITEITPNGSANITISLKKLNKPIFENILIAKDNEVLENITFEISFTDNENITQNNSNTKYYCSELGGKFCSTLETCSGETVQSLDGSCCVGVCAIEESESSNWISYVLVLSILIVIIIIYMRYKKTKSIKSKNLAINSILKKRI